eukprot:jgi/Tetstr1/457802/TSEL_044347.t1
MIDFACVSSTTPTWSNDPRWCTPGIAATEAEHGKLAADRASSALVQGVHRYYPFVVEDRARPSQERHEHAYPSTDRPSNCVGMSGRGGGCGPPPPAAADNGAREQLRSYRDARRLDWGSERFYRATVKDVAPKPAAATAALLGGALLLAGAGGEAADTF